MRRRSSASALPNRSRTKIGWRWDVLPILAIAASLTGCASSPAFDDAFERSLLSSPEAVPPYRKLVAEEIKKFKQQDDSARLEISEPRWAEHLGGPAWLVCVKFNTDMVSYYYAFYIRKESVIETRIAVGTDRCGREAYTSFDPKQHT